MLAFFFFNHLKSFHSVMIFTLRLILRLRCLWKRVLSSYQMIQNTDDWKKKKNHTTTTTTKTTINKESKLYYTSRWMSFGQIKTVHSVSRMVAIQIKTDDIVQGRFSGRAPDSWSKGHGFESWQERRENFPLHVQLSVPTFLSVSVPLPCYCSSTYNIPVVLPNVLVAGYS